MVVMWMVVILMVVLPGAVIYINACNAAGHYSGDCYAGDSFAIGCYIGGCYACSYDAVGCDVILAIVMPVAVTLAVYRDASGCNISWL